MNQNRLLSAFIVVGILFMINKILSLIDFQKYNIIITLLNYSQLIIIVLSLWLFSVSKKWIIFANIILFFGLVILLEIICFFLLGIPATKNKKFTLPDYAPDHIGHHVGYLPYADSVYHEVKVNSGDTVYNVRNSIDHFNRRLTPEHDSTRNRYALFFGCSICFGQGLNDNQTFPYYFQKNTKDFNSYNYGYAGYGTHQMLARFEYADLSTQIKEKDGICVYVFFWGHIARTIGAMNIYTDWGWDTPYYTMDDGKLVRRGKFGDGRGLISSLYELCYQWSIIKYFNINFPLGITDDHLLLTAEIIRKSRDFYRQQFQNDNFHILIYPNWREMQKKEDIERFKEFLQERNISCIDLSDTIEYGPSYTLGGDPHPNANTNNLLSGIFIRELKIY